MKNFILWIFILLYGLSHFHYREKRDDKSIISIYQKSLLPKLGCWLINTYKTTYNTFQLLLAFKIFVLRRRPWLCFAFLSLLFSHLSLSFLHVQNGFYRRLWPRSECLVTAPWKLRSIATVSLVLQLGVNSSMYHIILSSCCLYLYFYSYPPSTTVASATTMGSNISTIIINNNKTAQFWYLPYSLLHLCRQMIRLYRVEWCTQTFSV